METETRDYTESTVEEGLRDILSEEYLPNWLFVPLLRALERVDPERKGKRFLSGLNFKVCGTYDTGGRYVKLDRQPTLDIGNLGLIDYGLRDLSVHEPFMANFTTGGNLPVRNGEYDVDLLLQTIAGDTTDALVGERTTIALDAVLWVYWLEEMFKVGIQSTIWKFNMDGEEVIMGAVEYENIQLSLILNLTKLRAFNDQCEVSTPKRLH